MFKIFLRYVKEMVGTHVRDISPVIVLDSRMIIDVWTAKEDLDTLESVADNWLVRTKQVTVKRTA